MSLDQQAAVMLREDMETKIKASYEPIMKTLGCREKEMVDSIVENAKDWLEKNPPPCVVNEDLEPGIVFEGPWRPDAEGQIRRYETESNDPKGDAGKLKCPLHLIPPYPMGETAHVHAHGADKYGPYNWRETQVEANTYIAAIMRHLNAWRDGENNDSESGFSHLAHIAANCNILLDAQRHGTLHDNRFRTNHESLQPEFAHLPKA